MDTSANTITTMGIISNEVYDDGQVKKYFKDNPENLVANGTTYEVINHTSDSTISGFNALLLQDTTTGNYTIAFRGTETFSLVDWITNILSGASNVNLQYNAAVSFVNKMMSDHGILASQLTLTGHSLGGILTQQVGATLGIKGYAYNPWGADALAKYPSNGPLNVIARVLEAVGAYTSSAESFAKDNIVNISYNDAGSLNGDGLSNALTGFISNHLGGSLMPIVGENVGVFDGHSMVTLNNAIAHYNEVLKHFTTDTIFNNLSAAYLSMKNYERTESMFNELGVLSAPEHSLSFNFLTETPSTTIASNAKTNTADLYALINLNPFAIEGNLPAYNNINPEDYSATYLEKRSEMLYYVMHPESSNTGNGTTYQDISLDITTTDKLLITPATSNEVKFGGVSADNISGYANDDYLFGGNGHDTLNNFSTCKPFRIQKALHVENQSKPKEEDNGLYQKVA